MLLSYMLPLPTNHQEIISRIPTSDACRNDAEKLTWMRVAIIHQIARDEVTEEELLLLAPFCKVLDMSTLTDPLVVMWHEANVNKHAVLGAIFHTDRGAVLFESLKESERIEYSDPWVTPMIKFAPTQVFARHALAALWSATSLESRPDLYTKIDMIRTRFGIDDEIYSELRRHSDFCDIHEDLVYH